MSEELETSRRETAERDNRVRALSEELETSRRETAERDNRVRALSEELKTSRRETAERDNRVRALSEELETSRRETAERDNRVRALSEELETSRRETAERDNRVRVLSEELKTSRQKIAERETRIASLTKDLERSRMRHVMALSHRGSRFGVAELEIDILLNPEWLDRARQRREREPAFELRRNGRRVAQTFVNELSQNLARIPAKPRLSAVGDTLYSIHDSVTGETLAALVAPTLRRARHIVGAVENRERPEVRGWVLDPSSTERSRRVALHVDGALREVVVADGQRADIARSKETGGHHGFLWRIPEGIPVKEGMRVDAFDADTGRPLRGSPVRIEDGRAVRSGRHGT